MLQRALTAALVILLAACRIERHPPAASRGGDDAVRETVLEFYAAAAAGDSARLEAVLAPQAHLDFGAGAAVPRDFRVLRVDAPQTGNLAAVWIVTGPGGRDSAMQHVLLERTRAGWQVRQLVTSPLDARRDS